MSYNYLHGLMSDGSNSSTPPTLWKKLTQIPTDLFKGPYPVEHREHFEDVRKLCNQDKPKRFKTILPKEYTVVKIAQGGYGEVFKVFEEDRPDKIYKVVKLFYYDYRHQFNNQLKLEAIRVFDALNELKASIRMRSLTLGPNNRCQTFMFIDEIHLIYDKYPVQFEEAQKVYRDLREKPIINKHKRFMLVYIMADKGRVLDNLAQHAYLSGSQCRSIMRQLVLALRIAEVSFEFEHRDLFVRNVLINGNQPAGSVRYRLNGIPFEFDHEGVVLTIIDFGLSRFIDLDNKIVYMNFHPRGGPDKIGPKITDWREFHLESNVYLASYFPEELQQKFPQVRDEFVCLKAPFYRNVYDFELECSCRDCTLNYPRITYDTSRLNGVFYTKREHKGLTILHKYEKIGEPIPDGTCRRFM